MAVSEEVGGVHVSIAGDYSQLQRDLEAAAGYARTAARTIADAFNAGGASGAGLARGFDQAKLGAYDFTRSAQAVIDKQKELDRELVVARGALVDVKLAYEQGAASANALSRAEDNLKGASDRANLALRDINRSAKEAADASAKAAADIEASWRRTQQGLTTVGIGLTAAITAPLIAGFTAAVTESNKFGLAMHEVASIMDNTSAASFKKLSADVLDLSVRLGVDATKAARGLYETISANVPEKNILSFLEVATKASIAGLTSTKVAVDGLTSILNAFRLETDQATKVADAMFVSVKLGKFRFDELSSSMAKAMPLASQLGVSFQEVLGAAAKITSTGVPVSEAFTQIQRAMASLIAPSGEMKNLFEKIFKTYNVDSGKALIQSQGLVGALQAVRDAAGDEEGAIFKAMRRMEGFRAVLELTGPNLESTKDFIEQVKNSAGRLDIAFQEIEKSGARGFDHLKASMEALAITAGDALAPSVGKIVKNMQPLIEGLISAVKWFAELHPAVQQTAIVMGAMAAAAGPLALMASGILRLREALLLLAGAQTLATGGLTAVTTGIGALVSRLSVALIPGTVGYLLYKAAEGNSLKNIDISGTMSSPATSQLWGVPAPVQPAKVQPATGPQSGGVVDPARMAEFDAMNVRIAKSYEVATTKAKEFGAAGGAAFEGVAKAASATNTSIDEFMTSWDQLHTEAVPTAEQLDAAMRSAASAAYDMAVAIDELPPIIGNVQQAADAMAAATDYAGKSMADMVPPDLKPKIEDITQATGRMGDQAVEVGNRGKEAMREIRRAVESIADALANSIIHWKGFGSAAMNVLEAVGEVILKTVIKRLLDASGLIDKLMSGIGAVLSKIGIGGLSGAAGAAASKAGASAAGGAASSASGAASAASGLMAGLGIAGLAVDVASGIATGIQLAHIESDVAKIEISTRQVKEQLVGGIQPSLNQWLPKLDYLLEIWKAIDSPNGAIGRIRDILWYGKINVNVVRGDAGTGNANDVMTGGMEPNKPLASIPIIPGEPSQGFTADVARGLSRGFADLNTAAKVFEQSSGYMLKAGETFTAAVARMPEPTNQQAIEAGAARFGVTPAQFKSAMDAAYAGLNANSKRGLSSTDVYQPVFGNTSIFADDSTDPNKIAQLKAIRDSLELYRAGNLSYAAYIAAVESATDKYQLTVASLDTLISRFSQLSDASTPEAQSIRSLIEAKGGVFSTPGVTPGYFGGGIAKTDLSGFTAAYQAIQQSGFGGTADITGNTSFVNPAMMRTGISGSVQMSDADKSRSLALYADWVQKFAAERAQQTADALAGMQSLALQQFSKAFQAATEGHNIRMDVTGKFMQLDQAGNLIDADTGAVLVNYEKLYNQFANPTGVPTGMQGTNGENGETVLNWGNGPETYHWHHAPNLRAYAAAPIDYSALLQNYSAKLNTSYTTPSVQGTVGAMFGGGWMGGDSAGQRTIIIQAFDPASRAIGRGLVDELQNNGIYR